MASFFIAIILCVFMVVLTVAINYEVLRITWQHLPRMQVKPRLRILGVAMAVFAGHTIAVWAYGIFYWLVVNYMDIGLLQYQTGGLANDFLTCIYYSASTYSSLGFGDIIPTDEIRLISGVQVLNGLVLIGWSASFTYLAMEKFWPLHKITSQVPTKHEN